MNLDLHFKATKRHIIILNAFLDGIERELEARDKDETRGDYSETPEELGFYKEYTDDNSRWWWRKDFPKHPFLKKLHIIIEGDIISVFCRTADKPYSEVNVLQRKCTPESLFDITLFLN